MSLIRKATEIGFKPKDTNCYLWEIQKWLREDHSVDITISIEGANSYCFYLYVNRSPIKNDYGSFLFGRFDSYDEALKSSLHNVLSIIKEKQTKQ